MERRRRRALLLLDAAARGDVVLTVPMPVVAEWWRGRSAMRDLIVRSVDLASPPLSVFQLAGEAIAAVPGATPIDAMVMAFAAARGDAVITSDIGDLERLRGVFPSVRVHGVGDQA